MEIFISAGESSGDLLGSQLARALWSIVPDAHISCLGGPLMESAGVSLVVDNRDISVVGASEVAAHIRPLYGSWRKIKSHLLLRRPDLVILIDFPDFNLLLGKFARKNGSKVFYYVSPQIWAWREGRVKTIRRIVDGMAVILPFEKSFYESHGMEVNYVGHPLVDILHTAPELSECNLAYRNSDGPLVGILPGSRRSEIKLLFELLMDSARIISHSLPDARFVIPVAPSLDAVSMESQAARWNLPLRVVRDDTYRVVRACDLILTASGTVTLEAALLETPMIITNRLSRISALIGKQLIRVKYIGLPNLIANREIAPEYVQDAATAEHLARRAIELLSNPALLESQRIELRRIRELLGDPGISYRVALLALDLARTG
ncbi:MAG: lipid-A-disaccharide synthase [Syntrophobacteraceae bacterium]